jgi:hypothetical protein
MVVQAPSFNLHGEATIQVLIFEKREIQETDTNSSE